MSDSFDDFVTSLMNEELPIATKRSTSEKKFPCGQCAGTGRYQGMRMHQQKSECFACRGTGFFKTDPRKLAENRAKRAKAKSDALRNGVDAMEEAHPALVAELRSVWRGGSSNAFISSLAEQLFTRGSLSDKQVSAWYRGKEKLEALKAQRAQEQAERAVTVDLTPIATMFSAAISGGYKKPMYRANGLRLKPGTGGALWVLTEQRMVFGTYGEQPGYEGKIVAGQFYPVREAAADTADKLKAIAADPKGEAIRHGRRTGTCSCCGRELTKHASIDAGIGPICAEKWGLA